jgi:hypothetical protein
MELLPRELQYSIVRILDIDSRRHLGIFTRLKIPEYLTVELDNVMKKRVWTKHGIMVRIGSNRGAFTTYRFLHNVHSSWIIHRTIGEEDGTFMESFFCLSNTDRWNRLGTERAITLEVMV